ncbi:MAG TPA: beta-galactosidase [Candidatus Eisenbergiella merdipullorum]|uniref:Beta-galactosidase n=1 Tax=Candidatus Eisenbergiella merdipullorum TaxID=2838553 RepID=A0A9D2I271_9FIRM|nr:beta-galactosidase [Candidatus Eisenbergiella merdipullorum]
MKQMFSYNSRYLEKDGKPWFPVMGEFHYSRYKEELWEEELYKIKAGGVNILSTYVIWIHHEEEEGKFDFTGCRDIGRFVSLCKKVGLYVFLRLGPWVHGEVRNGGFPDWLMKKGEEGIRLRSNDKTYLEYVERFWKEVFAQVKGQMLEDGGPVIGIQIENEYGHVGGLRGEEGEAHMRRLTAMAQEIGFHAPLYTATGWGGACIGDLLPVMGGYCEAPWDQSLKELPPNANFVFSHIRNDALIACDHHVEDAITFNEADFPFLTAELGGGLQVTSHRRPVASGRDIGAMSLAKLGSGVAMLGYYMYHGGSNPEGKLSTLQESRATGYLNDLPEISYDFNAPIRQYGTISDSYREVRLLAYFLHDFGEDLAALDAEITPDNERPDDFHTLRTSCRHDETHGYLFYNNYQRRYPMDSHKNVELKGLCKEEVAFPPIDIPDGEYGFFPYHMKLQNARLRYALATPLCRLETAQKVVYVFYGDREPQFCWETEETAEILQLTREEALQACRISLDQDYLILSKDFVWEENGKVRAVGGPCTILRSYPELPEESLPGFCKRGQEGAFTVYERKVDQEPARIEWKLTKQKQDSCVYEVQMDYPEKELEKCAGRRDTILSFRYAGDRMNIYCGGKKINDHFYTGQEVILSLGYFDFPKKLEVEIFALHQDTPVFLENWPEMEDGAACRLENVSVKETFS